MRNGLRLTREMLDQPAMAPYRGRELAPGEAVRSDAEIDGFVRDQVGTSHHPCGTCKMGTDEQAVVDPDLRVHGLDGLRVVDASIMPREVSANLNCPTLMIAEKASDLIAGRAPLAAEHVPYYRGREPPRVVS